MIRICLVFRWCAAWSLLLHCSAAWAQATAERVYLVRVSKGEMTSDTGNDDQTKPQLVQEPKLGGQAMQVKFAAGDTIGQRAKLTNWSKFSRLCFEVLNLGKPATLELNVLHAGSKNYDTRVVVPLQIKPGKNEVALPLAKFKNVDGSAPDLAHVVRWYLADNHSEAPTLVFGDITLEKAADKSAATQAASGKSVVHGDPIRIKRIRAAKMPAIKEPVMFDTPEADAILAALEVYPEDNLFNLVVSDWPLHPDSQAIIASIGVEKPLRYNPDMGFILVPPDQKRVEVNNVEYAEESDPGPFPLPENLPIEGWPAYYQREKSGLSLDDVQRDKLNAGGDRHAIAVDPVNRIAYEFYQMKKTAGGWQAVQTSIFDLKTNKLRPDGWTSSDAAGLPLFPAVVRYDELRRGAVEHAMRVTVRRSRRAYVYPATHQASQLTDANLPRMGERIRLKAGVDISKFTPEVKAILQGLKTYGMFVADNGLEWSISVTPDPRIPVLHEELRKIKGSEFEVVVPPNGYIPAQ